MRSKAHREVSSMTEHSILPLSRFQPAPTVYLALLDEANEEGAEVVLLDLHRDMLLGLNRVAMAMWELLAAGKTADEVVTQLRTSVETRLL
jgi:hypothetical protein